ncbi:hypothetical protein THAOC_20453 [Thalassiosira oceanica]|uniref:Uncharacterized protein n=1 Tax=Thalassiosira oceanica TaxID=159749 RepID=K0SLI1_THAOC|nr:hypothetical protein THAOC_20453 [Thalassiosira oceanica]|eukprot:EJK59342.1 hypothetical protein THAOC_20453 [Thalassiosira oceanica]
MWPGGSSVPRGQMLCSLNQSSGSGKGSWQRRQLTQHISSINSCGSVTLGGNVINTDDTGDLIEGGGSTQLQRTPRQQPPAAQPAASAHWLPWRLIFHEQVKRPAPTAPQQWLGPRLFASSEEAHPGCLAAHRLVGEIPSIGGGSSTSSCWVEDSGQISFGRVSHSVLVALAQSAAARQRSLVRNFDGPSLGGGGRDQMHSGSAGSDWT